MILRRMMVAVFSLVLAGCGMGLDEAMPLLEADVVEITERFFPDQDYRLRLAPTGGDFTGCYYPIVDSYLPDGLGNRDRDTLFEEIEAYMVERGWEIISIDTDSFFGRLEADHPGGAIRVSIRSDGSVYVVGSAGACTRDPDLWIVNSHSPPADD